MLILLSSTIVLTYFDRNTMKKIIILVFIITITSSYSLRVKRRVVFRKNSKFFVRLNGKEPILNFTTIFQHGWGFRLNFDLPDSVLKLHKLYKRDVKNDFQPFLEKAELQNYFCVLKYLAKKIESMEFDENCGMLCRIGEIIKGHSGNDAEFFRNILGNTTNLGGNCPKMEYVTSLYTDL